MPLTLDQIRELEERAIASRDITAIQALAAAAREGATDAHKYLVTTEDGEQREMTVQQYLSLTATDLVGATVTLVQ